jgi:hypothetical protein
MVQENAAFMANSENEGEISHFSFHVKDAKGRCEASIIFRIKGKTFISFFSLTEIASLSIILSASLFFKEFGNLKFRSNFVCSQTGKNDSPLLFLGRHLKAPKNLISCCPIGEFGVIIILDAIQSNFLQ